MDRFIKISLLLYVVFLLYMLGILYESCNQPKDAYACYVNATRVGETNNNNEGERTSAIQITPRVSMHMNPNLSQRIQFLQTHLGNAPMPSITSKLVEILAVIFKSLQISIDSFSNTPTKIFFYYFRRRQLPSIEEAWNLPISAEMSSRQQQQQQTQGNNQRNGQQQFQKSQVYNIIVVL